MSSLKEITEDYINSGSYPACISCLSIFMYFISIYISMHLMFKHLQKELFYV